jgi:hypothetical protein
MPSTAATSPLSYDVVEENCAHIRQFLWHPGVAGDVKAKKGQLFDAKSAMPGPVQFPDLIYFSSHGYPNGELKSNFERTGADAAHNKDYHVIFKIPTVGAPYGWFEGNTWGIFSLCNVLRPELAFRWAGAIRKSKSTRGLLGFYSTSPGPGTTIDYMTKFLQHKNLPIIDAWKAAHEGTKNPWAAIFYESAKTDTFESWTMSDLPPIVDRGSKMLYFNKTAEYVNGIDMATLDPTLLHPCHVWWSHDGKLDEVTEKGALKVGETFRASIGPKTSGWPPGAASISVTIVNLREDWWETSGRNTPDVQKLGVRGAVNSLGKSLPLEECALSTRHGNPSSKDTVTFPMSLTAGAKWAGIEFVLSDESRDYYYGLSAELWFKFAVLDAGGRRLSTGMTLFTSMLKIRSQPDPRSPLVE